MGFALDGAAENIARFQRKCSKSRTGGGKEGLLVQGNNINFLDGVLDFVLQFVGWEGNTSIWITWLPWGRCRSINNTPLRWDQFVV